MKQSPRLPIRRVHFNIQDGALTVYSSNAATWARLVPSEVTCDGRYVWHCAVACVPDVMLGAVLWWCRIVQMAIFSHKLYRDWIVLICVALAQAARDFLGGGDPANLVSPKDDHQHAWVWRALLHVLAEFFP